MTCMIWGLPPWLRKPPHRIIGEDRTSCHGCQPIQGVFFCRFWSAPLLQVGDSGQLKCLIKASTAIRCNYLNFGVKLTNCRINWYQLTVICQFNQLTCHDFPIEPAQSTSLIHLAARWRHSWFGGQDNLRIDSGNDSGNDISSCRLLWDFANCCGARSRRKADLQPVLWSSKTSSERSIIHGSSSTSKTNPGIQISFIWRWFPVITHLRCGSRENIM